MPAAHVAKVEAIVAFLSAATGMEAVQRLQVWKAHRLTGDRKDTWSLAVTRNWRMTFQISAGTEEAEVIDLDFEDYH